MRGKFYNPKNTEVVPSKNAVKIARSHSIPYQLLTEVTSMCKRKIMDISIEYYSVGLAYTLWKKFGFGPKRLPEILEAVRETFDNIENGDIDINRLKEELKEIGVVVDYESILKMEENR